MAREQQTRDYLIGFRVTQHEHTLLRQVAAADERNVTGFLRKLLAETVVGFGTTLAPSTTKEATR
jgi:uncharacterized protein (DUF1778 family)